MKSPIAEARAWLDAPASVLRLEIVRIFAPLAILGFLAPRIAYADEWIGNAGFRVPDLGGDARQALYIPGLPSWAAWTVAGVMVASGLAVSLGLRTRVAASVFAATIVFATLSDRAAAFTVSKISPPILVALAFGPAGQRFGIDAFVALRRGGRPSPKHKPLGALRFFQIFIPVFYSASGIAKAHGEWFKDPFVLYSHLHDSYQTPVSYYLAGHVPPAAWTPLQALVLTLEALAPFWFFLRSTRTVAWVLAAGMHIMIGLMFGPVLSFGLLMLTIVTASFMPDALVDGLERLAARAETAVARTGRKAQGAREAG